MSDHATKNPVDDLLDTAALDDDLPRRPRRRLLTPVTAGLFTVLVAALGFFAGVQVQKGQQSPGSGRDLAAAFGARGSAGAAARAAGARGSGMPGGAIPGGGTVANLKGSTLYVQLSSGTTVRVKTTAASEVTRTAFTSVTAIHPGDTVVVQGSRAADGTYKATQITATAKGVNPFAALAAGFGGMPGGGPPSGGANGPAS